MMSIILGGTLNQGIVEELRYSKYDYRNEETNNSRNVHSQKTIHINYGDIEINISPDRKSGVKPQIVKKSWNTVTYLGHEKIHFRIYRFTVHMCRDIKTHSLYMFGKTIVQKLDSPS